MNKKSILYRQKILKKLANQSNSNQLINDSKTYLKSLVDSFTTSPQSYAQSQQSLQLIQNIQSAYNQISQLTDPTQVSQMLTQIASLIGGLANTQPANTPVFSGLSTLYQYFNYNAQQLINPTTVTTTQPETDPEILKIKTFMENFKKSQFGEYIKMIDKRSQVAGKFNSLYDPNVNMDVLYPMERKFLTAYKMLTPEQQTSFRTKLKEGKKSTNPTSENIRYSLKNIQERKDLQSKLNQLFKQYNLIRDESPELKIDGIIGERTQSFINYAKPMLELPNNATDEQLYQTIKQYIK